METLDELLDLQSGVVSRRQMKARGHSDSDIARKRRRKDLVQVHEGVYVNHTGELTWLQRAWAAVLFSWPSALTHQSALRAADGPGRKHREEDVIHVAIAKHRRLTAPDGVRLHRLADYDDRVQSNFSPPRLRYDDAVLLIAGDAPTEFACIGVLAAAVQGRRTTAQRLLTTAEKKTRLPRRAWIISVLADIAEGTHSVLEHGYLGRVERAHGLLSARRQRPESADDRRVYRDASYETGLEVELDGRLFHDNAAARDADLDRDLDAATFGRQTIRLSWGQVFERPCRTADRIAVLLRRGGWAGQARRCGPDCEIRAAAA